jgi:hypothetical protein
LTISADQEWKSKRKIATLPGVDVTPQIVLARSLDKAPRMKGIVAVIHWDDGTWDIDWSRMELRDLIYLKEMFNLSVVEEITRKSEGD